jgi:hypothetical protein
LFVFSFVHLIMCSGKFKSVASIAVILLVVSNDWHFGVIQLYAWTSMAWNNSESMAYSEAIVKALDGSEVCGICKLVIRGEDPEGNEKFQVIEFVSKSPLIFLAANPPVLGSSVCQERIAFGVQELTAWLPDAQSPPPKGLVTI